MTTADDKPWVYDGSESPEHEDHLVGDVHGLSILRDALDAAIKEGHSRIDSEGLSCPWVGVKVLSSNPFKQGSHSGAFQEKVIAAGCITMVIAAFGLIGLGISKLVELIK